MNVLLINGSPNEKGCTYTALLEIKNQFTKNGIESEIFHIGKGPIRGCTGCKTCKKQETFRCIYKEDKVNECIEKIEKADGVIIGSPVHYASIAGSCSSFLDRVFYAKKSFELKLGAGIVSCRRAGSTASLDQIDKYFTISSMPIVSSQYWNMVHGNTKEEVTKDLEGMQTMRVLADNMTWLLKCIEEGKKKISHPTREIREMTNFIRQRIIYLNNGKIMKIL